MKVEVEKIKDSPCRWDRTIHKRSVSQLAKSLEEFGQLQPILVRKVDAGYELIAGMHRLQAAQKSGQVTIEATVFDVSDIDARLISLEENLRRYAPDAKEWAFGLVEFKKFHEEKHGKPKKGRPKKDKPAPDKKRSSRTKAAPPAPSVTEPENGTPRPNFEEEAAERFNVTPKTVRRAVARVEKLSETASKAWKNDEITDSQADELVKLPKVKQEAVLPDVVGRTRDETRSIVQDAKTSQNFKKLERLFKECVPISERLNKKILMIVSIVQAENVTKVGGIGSVRIGSELAMLHDSLDKLERHFEREKDNG